MANSWVYHPVSTDPLIIKMKIKKLKTIQQKINETPDFCPNCNKEIRLPIIFWIDKWGMFAIGFILALVLAGVLK